MKHKGLGKGLGALIPERTAGPENHIQMIPLGQIKSGIQQPRTTFDNDRITELAESIRMNGIIQPVILRPVPSGFELVAGERRWRAAKLAGLLYVPAIIRKMDDREALEVSLIENLQRDDLNPIEAARGYKCLIDQYELTQESVAQIVGKDRSTIANSIRLLNLPETVQNMLEDGRLTTGHAKVLLSVTDTESLISLAEQAVQSDWSVRMLEKQIQKNPAPIRTCTAGPVYADPNLDAVLNSLRVKFATKIKCLPKKNGGGRIVLEYYNETDFLRLLDLLRH